MKYTSVKTAKFIKRPNRFIAHVMIDDKEEVVHIKNTGRCKEILQQGVDVILEESGNPARKTKYSVIAAFKGDALINIDSQVPNSVVYEAVKEGRVEEIRGIKKLLKEKVYGNSRFDLYFETDSQKGFIEVKGVTLETQGVAMFPDAPTERGSKHIYEMVKAVEAGYVGIIFFLVQMKGIRYFVPHEARDPEFAKALRYACDMGVKVLSYDSVVREDGIVLGDPVEIRI